MSVVSFSYFEHCVDTFPTYLVGDVQPVKAVLAKERQYLICEILLSLVKQLQLPLTHTLCHSSSWDQQSYEFRFETLMLAPFLAPRVVNLAWPR